MSVMLIVFTAISLVFGVAIDYLNVEKMISNATGLQSNYGLVGAMMLLNVYVLMYLGINVGKARKKYGVEYPNMYADAHHCKDPKIANSFNCIQRARMYYFLSFAEHEFNWIVSEYPLI